MKLIDIINLSSSILNEGIDIHALQKTSDDETFQTACQIFKARVQGDNEARKRFDLKDLSKYKDDHLSFINAVVDAVEFIQNRVKDKNARKVEKLKGVDMVYEDENCFIVSPKSAKYSHAAAYIDGGTANWCIAAPEEYDADDFWRQYDAVLVLYIYKKAKTKVEENSWAGVIDNRGFKILAFEEPPYSEKRIFCQLEDRNNDSQGRWVVHKEILGELLKETQLVSEEKLYGIIMDFVKEKREGLLDSFRIFDAVKEGDVKLVKKYVKNGADVNFARDNAYLVDVAVENPNREILKVLLKAGMRIREHNKIENRDPLYYAIFHDWDDISELIAKNIREYSVCGDDAIGYAAKRNKPKVIEALVNNFGWSSEEVNSAYDLKMSVKAKSWECVRLFVEKYDAIKNFQSYHETFLAWFIDADTSVEIVEYLLQKGAEINSKKKHVTSPLYSAVVCENEKVVEFLLKHGADPNTGHYDGETPLIRSLKNETGKITKMLLDAGAKLDDEELVYQTIEKNSIEVLQAMLKKGVDFNKVFSDKYGASPLEYALMLGKVEAFEFLLKNGAKIDTIESPSDSLWMQLPNSYGKKTIPLLLKYGVKPDWVSERNGQNLLHLLAFFEMKEAVFYTKLFLKYGADKNARDKDGKTPLDYAKAFRHPNEELIKLLS